MNLKRSLRHSVLHNLATILVTASLVLSLAPQVPARATEQGDSWADTIEEMLASGDYAEGEAIVGLLGGGDDLRTHASLSASLEPLMVVGAKAAGIDTGSGLVAQSSQDVTLTLVSSDSLSTEEILRSLADDPYVAFAEPNYYVTFCDEGDAEPEDEVGELPAEEEGEELVEAEVAEAVEGASEPEAAVQPEEAADEATGTTTEPEATTGSEATSGSEAKADEEPITGEGAGLTVVTQSDGTVPDLRNLQWGCWDTSALGMKALEATGSYSINTPNFDNAQVGANMDNEVVVAILDHEVDFSNPDLADRAYTFSPELQAQLGCDEHGYNASATGTDGILSHEPGDHGTHTAGIVGASWDGQGISGVASNVKIVSIQMITTDRTEDENRRTSLANGLRAFDFVKRANEAGVGIKVTNSSWSYFQVSKALDAALYELGETQGVVNVFAAGNDSHDANVYPLISSTLVKNPYAITVAASTQLDELASFTNYGSMTVDLAAPGMTILSTVTESGGNYIPGVASNADILFEDFEDDAPIVTIQQIDDKNALASSPAALTTEAHMNGGHGAAAPVDLDCVYEESFFGDTYRAFRIDFDIEAAKAKTGIDVVESLRSAQELYLGFSLCTSKQYGNTTAESITTNMFVPDEDGEREWIVARGRDYSRSGSLVNVWEPLTENDLELDFDHLDGHLVIDLEMSMDPECPTVYFDSIGVGVQTVPYGYMNGTSMAAPMVTGAAAVLSSQTGLEGRQLASLVRSKVRIPEAGPLEVRSGGVFDFDVDGSVEDGVEALAPDIEAVEVSGTTVTITGANFGEEGGSDLFVASDSGGGSGSGSVDVTRYVVANDETKVSSSVTSWSDDRIELELDSPFVGIMCVRVCNAAGKQGTFGTFVSKGETVYEQDLPFASDTGEPYEFDGVGDHETRGPLVGLGCKLYYLPASEPTEKFPAHRDLYCFDLKTQTWSQLPSLPEWLQGVSAVMYEGKIVVEGASVDILPSGEPTDEFMDGELEERVYVYDPSASSWSEASHAGMYVGQTILNDDGQLKLVGGYREEYDEEYEEMMNVSVPVCSYDLGKGLVEELDPLVGFISNPIAVSKDGVIYLYDSHGYYMVIVKDGEAEYYSNTKKLPDIPDVDESDLIWGEILQPYADPFVSWGALAVCSEGIIFVGPPSADGTTDTHILRDPDGVFEPYEKRATEARLQSVAACTYRGRLFVIGSSWVEPNQRLFRETAMDVPEYPGDIPCETEPTPTPEPTPEPAPKVLPQTSDSNVPNTVLVGLGAAGVAAIVAGLVLRRRR